MGPGVRRDDGKSLIQISNSEYASAVSRRDASEVLHEPLPRGSRGMPGARCTRGLVCKQCTKESAHEHTGSAEASGIPCAMALRLMARSPRRRILLVTVIGGLKVLSRPVGPAKTSADLTPATGARTTRFCRTLQRRSSARRPIAHERLALRSPCAPALPRPPHPVPTFVTMANAPRFKDRTREF
jgi:hypothetical protein